jgi:hypothetical protein
MKFAEAKHVSIVMVKIACKIHLFLRPSLLESGNWISQQRLPAASHVRHAEVIVFLVCWKLQLIFSIYSDELKNFLLQDLTDKVR